MSEGVAILNGREIHFWTREDGFYTDKDVSGLELQQLRALVDQCAFASVLERVYDASV